MPFGPQSDHASDREARINFCLFVLSFMGAMGLIALIVFTKPGQIAPATTLPTVEITPLPYKTSAP